MYIVIWCFKHCGRICNVKEIESNINIEISKVATWLQRNKWQLNVSKSKFMMFLKHPKTLPNLITFTSFLYVRNLKCKLLICVLHVILLFCIVFNHFIVF